MREEESHPWKRESYKRKQRIFERERDSWLGDWEKSGRREIRESDRDGKGRRKANINWL